MEVREPRTLKGFAAKARILGQQAEILDGSTHYIINADWRKFTGDRPVDPPMYLLRALRGGTLNLLAVRHGRSP